MLLAMSNNRWLGRLAAPTTLLSVGIFVRLCTFLFLNPSNNDDHFNVIRLLVANGRLPLMTDTGQAYHPPLYYVMAAPLLAIFGTEKAVQSLSLILSIGTLVILYILVFTSGFVRGRLSQLYSFLMVCFLPQFVKYTLYVSNDTLAIFLGALIVWQCRRFILTPQWKESLLLAILTGLGLLTKATFLAYVPVLFALVAFMFIQKASLAKAIWAASAFLVVVLIVGSYKFVDNFERFHDPLVSNLDLPAEEFIEQKTHYMGLRSYLDFNIISLIKSPTTSWGTGANYSVPGYPALLYATFFYSYGAESNFTGNLHWPFKYLGSLTYVAGLLPTIVFLVGLAGLGKKLSRFIKTFNFNNSDECLELCVYVAVCLLASNCVLLFVTVLKYHVWTIMQSRLLFPSMMGIIGAFEAGIEIVRRNTKVMSMLNISMFSLVVLFSLYLLSEVGHQIVLRLLN
jgi:4-amino-4-deoxy-L-arabinose transferase-like glycosyltransferase